jgi:hypothetical protein
VRIRAYFAVIGAESTVRKFGQMTSRERIVIKELGGKRPLAEQAREPSLWTWRTERVALDPEDLEKELERFASSLVELEGPLGASRPDPIETVLTLIVHLDEKESPMSLSMSSRTVRELSSLKAAFDVDFVSVMDDGAL